MCIRDRPFSGKAELLNYRGRYQSVASGLASRMNLCDEDAGSVRVEDTDEGVDITVYILSLIHIFQYSDTPKRGI